MRVLIADKLAAAATDRIEAAGCAVTTDPALKEDRLSAALRELDPDVLVVRSTKVGRPQLDAARNLSLIIRAGAGVNTIDLDGASSRGVYVSNCPGKNAVAVAELVIGQLVNLDRRIADNVIALREGRWAKKEFDKARGLYGRTLAVLGVGQIGREVSSRALAMGMVVRGWDRDLTPEGAQELGIEFAATALDACRGADALTVHLAFSAETRGLVGRKLLDALRPGAYVINTARGGIVDETALREAMHARGVRAGLDVFENEPDAGADRFTDDIAQEPGLYGTHHIGASTEQASEAVADEVARIIETYLRTGRVPNCVNLAATSAATHLLVVRHADEVGVLAAVLDALRQDGINVQEMENIIFQGGHAACARIQIDRAPSLQTRQHVESSPHVFATSVVPLVL